MRSTTFTAAVGAAAVALGLLPATGSAKTFCVNKPSCVGTAAASVNAAATLANNSAGADRVEIGEGTYEGVAMAFADWADPVEVVGAGRGKTILRSLGTSGVNLGKADSTVSDLTVQIGDKSVVGIDLSGAGGKAERVEVIGSSVETSASDIGIILRHGGTVRDAIITMPMHPQYADYGVSVSPNSASDPANVPTVIENVAITSGYAIHVQPSNRAATIRRATLRGGIFGVGIATPVPQVTLEDVSASAFTSGAPFASANGVNIYGFDSAATPTVVDLRHVTASSTSAGGRALSVQQQGVVPLTINAVDSAFLGGLGAGGTGSFDIELAGFKTGTQMHATRSAWRSTNTWIPPEYIVQGPAASRLIDDGGNVDLAGHPGQQVVDVAAGDLRPVAGSVLVDNGTPGQLEAGVAGLDAAGSARLVDGDGDGDARRDIGAYEAGAGTNAGHVGAVAMGTLCQVTACPGTPGGPGGGQTKVLPRTTVLKLMPKKARKEISGTTTGAVSAVAVSITRKQGKACQALSAKQKWVKTPKLKGGGCTAAYVLAAKGTASWKLTLKQALPKGKYVVAARATGPDGTEAAPALRVFKR